MPSNLIRCAVLLMAVAVCTGDAFAAGRSSRSASIQRLNNPFSIARFSRLSSDRFGFPTLVAEPVVVPTTEVSSPAPEPAPATASEPESTLGTLDFTPSSAMSRAPYRPPVRSPFRPPPRPPF